MTQGVATFLKGYWWDLILYIGSLVVGDKLINQPNGRGLYTHYKIWLGFPIQALMTDLAGCRIYEVDRPAKRADMVTLVWDRCDMYVTDSNAMSVDFR